MQGLADVFAMLKMPFDSDRAKKLNNDIFETIYTDWKLRLKLQRRDLNLYQKSRNLIDTIDKGNVDDKQELSELKKELSSLKKVYKPTKEELNRTNYFGSYSSFEGSPLSEGKFQFNLWGHDASERYIWDNLRAEIKKRC